MRRDKKFGNKHVKTTKKQTRFTNRSWSRDWARHSDRHGTREGAYVFATDINQETLADLQLEAESLGTIETFTLDVTDNDAVVAGCCPCAARYSVQLRRFCA